MLFILFQSPSQRHIDCQIYAYSQPKQDNLNSVINGYMVIISSLGRALLCLFVLLTPYSLQQNNEPSDLHQDGWYDQGVKVSIDLSLKDGGRLRYFHAW